MTINQLLQIADVTPAEAAGEADITDITMDSRQATAGSLFVCMPGLTRDSETFIPDAAANGAVAALVNSPAGLESARSYGMAGVLVPNQGFAFADAVWKICDAFYDHPTRNMKVIGVTGTNGKTTTAWLLRDIFAKIGLKSAYLGTLGFQLPGEERVLNNTTPFAVELYGLLAEARDRGVEFLAMEVSSHALAEHRVDGIEFDVAVFTNLTQDHLDFHGTMAEYEAAKWRLFDELPRQTKKDFVGVFNMTDPVGRAWSGRMGDRRQVRYAVVDKLGAFGAVHPGLDLEAEPYSVAVDSIHLVLQSRTDADHGFTAPLGGSYNVENLASAVAGARALGYPLGDVTQAAIEVRPVPGRFEAVRNDKGIGVLVDYAHTPDALEKLLDAVRPLTSGRVITVFGCGGDRDRTKRPKMAKAASERSDLTIATSDNPRTEDPQAILNDVLPGIVPGKESVAIIDREEAIHHAIKAAKPGDIVVIAGKGHENYQIIGRTKHPMDDRLMAKAALEALP